MGWTALKAEARIWHKMDAVVTTNDGAWNNANVFSGTPDIVSGQWDNALTFGGVNEYLQWTSGVDAEFQDLATWTLFGWFEAVNYAGTDDDHTAFSVLGGAGGADADSLVFDPYHKWGGGSGGRGLSLHYRGSDTLQWSESAGHPGNNSGLQPLGIVHDGSNLKVYHNGSFVKTQANTDTLHTTIVIVQIGSRLYGTGLHVGNIDDFYWFNRDLSLAELDHLRLHTEDSGPSAQSRSLGMGLGLIGNSNLGVIARAG